MGRKPHKHLNMPPGMRPRAAANGRVLYYLERPADASGKRKREPLGDDYVLALRRYAELVESPKAPPVTVPEVLTRWQTATAAGRPMSTAKDIEYAVKPLVEFFSNPAPAPIEQIKPVHITQYLGWRKKSPVRANREVSWLSAAWNWARSEGLTDEPNPCDGVKRHKETGRKIYAEDEWLAAIMECADEPLREGMDLAYLTGQRPSDMRDFSETDIRDGVLKVEQSKTGAILEIAVIGELAALIDRIKARKAKIPGVRTLSLLCKENGERMGKHALRYRFDKARAAAAEKYPALAPQILQVQFRDLRAKAGSDVRRQSDLDSAQALLGHTRSAMTEHYTRKRRGDLVKPVK